MTQRMVTTRPDGFARWPSVPRKELAQSLFTGVLVAVVAAITVLALAV